MIYKVSTYIDDVGHKITAFEPQGEGSKAEYHGAVMLNTEMGAVPFEFEFDEDTTLEECFEKFEEVAQKEVDKKIQEVKDENLIVTPGQAAQQDMGGGLSLV